MDPRRLDIEVWDLCLINIDPTVFAILSICSPSTFEGVVVNEYDFF